MAPKKSQTSSKTAAATATLTFERVPSSSLSSVLPGTVEDESAVDLGSMPTAAEMTTTSTQSEMPTTTSITTDMPKELEPVQSAFKLCAPKRPSPPSPSDMDATQGATFYAIFPDLIPRDDAAFKGQDYCFARPYMVQPIAPGRASAPYEYSRGSKKSKDQQIAFNKMGQPLTQWGNSTHSDIRFWGWEKKGFNRGNRIENQTWIYGGGHTMSMCLSQKDLQPTDYDGSIPLFLEKKVPSDDMLQAFDLVRVSILPKNDDGLKKDRKTCFTLKAVGSTMRTLSSVLAHLRATMHKSKEDAEEDSLHLLRGTGKYAIGDGKLLQYAHQIECMPPKDDKENYAASEITTCSFLLEDVAPDTTFMYEENSIIIRMCIKPTSGNPVCVEIPRHAFLKNANATSLHTAAGFYTLAASCPGAMCVFTMHSRFWGSMLWDPMCGYGEPTAFRGTPIVDVSKLLSPLVRSDLYITSAKIEGEVSCFAQILISEAIHT